MTRSIVIKRLTFGSLFQLTFISFAVGLTPFCILCGIAGAWGADTISLGNQPVHGWGALVAGIVIGPIMGFFFAVFGSAFSFFGLWLYGLFRPMTIDYLPLADGLAPTEPER